MYEANSAINNKLGRRVPVITSNHTVKDHTWGDPLPSCEVCVHERYQHFCYSNKIIPSNRNLTTSSKNNDKQFYK